MLKNLIFRVLSLGATVILLLSSCKTYKNVPYFIDIPDTVLHTSVKTTAFHAPYIQPDDILLINVQTLDEKSNQLFAASNTVTQSIGSSSVGMTGNQATAGHLVDKEGNIELPIIGVVHVAGLTTQQARDMLKGKIRDLYKEATVDVRFNNFKITIMGEVARPATYVITEEKISVLDALGLAGDLTIYGKRDKVMLIRDSADTKNMVRINLNSKDFISSPYFWMQQNDIIYVEPDTSKAASLDMARTRNYAIAASVLSLLIVIATRVN